MILPSYIGIIKKPLYRDIGMIQGYNGFFLILPSYIGIVVSHCLDPNESLNSHEFSAF